MLSKRKQTRLNWRYISILAYYNEANRISYKGIKIAHSEIAFLSACLLENKRTNDLVPLKRIKSIIGVKLSVDRLVDRLINLGLLLRPGYGLYLVSSEGEYFLRDLESMFTRIAENRDLSRWRKIVSEDDPRLKYVRPARVKGSFVLAILKTLG